ncbi:uncharacterized protein [Miscanthus floridulus]
MMSEHLAHPFVAQRPEAHEAILKVLDLQCVVKVLENPNCLNGLKKPAESPVGIAMVGKYTGLSYSYLSVIKLFCMRWLLWTGNLWWTGFLPVIFKILWQKRFMMPIKKAWESLKGAYGVLVPGGFGDREVQEKILATKYAREFHILLFAWVCKSQ